MAEPLTVSVPEDLASQLRLAVKEGEYRSADEAVADALSLWTASREASAIELRRAVREADESGEDIDDVDAMFDRLQSRYSSSNAPGKCD